jgi:hypothetical protein
MIGDHHGQAAARATLLVRTVDGIIGTHSATLSYIVLAGGAGDGRTGI